MSLAPDVDSNLLIGRGALYFDRLGADGNPTGELDLGNCAEFSVKQALTLKEHFTSRGGVKRRDLNLLQDVKFSIPLTLDEYSKENLLLAICGDAVEYLTQSAGAATATVAACRGRWLETGFRSIKNTVVSHGGTVFTALVDYLVDNPGGRVMPLSTGAIYENEPLLVSFEYDAICQPKLVAGKREVLGLLRFIPNITQGPSWELKAWKCKLKLEEAIQFVTDDWGLLKLVAEVMSDEEAHPAEPFFTVLGLKDAPGVDTVDFSLSLDPTDSMTVEFTNLCSGPIDSYLWDLGDGTTSPDASPAPHTYATAGTKTVSLTATNEYGSTKKTRSIETHLNILHCLWKFDEGAGLVVKDSGVNGCDGTWSGSGAHWSGAYGLFTAAASDVVKISNAPYLNPTTGITIGGRVNRTAESTVYDAVIKKTNWTLESNGVGGPNYYLRMWLKIGGIWVGGPQTDPLNWGQEYHIVGTYDGSFIRIYQDGVSKNAPAPASGSVDTDTGEVWIGSDPANTNRLWIGKMKDMRMYDSGLTAAEVLAWFNE